MTTFFSNSQLFIAHAQDEKKITMAIKIKKKSISVRGFQTNFFPACNLFAALALVLSMILLIVELLKKSWNKDRGVQSTIVSSVGPGALVGLNRNGVGLASFSSLLCQRISWVEVEDDPRPHLNVADLCALFLFVLDFGGGESSSDEDSDG